MIRRSWALPATLCLTLGLGACQSARFAGFGDDSPPRARVAQPAPAYNTPGPVEPVEAVPSGSVSSAPLPPPPGSPVAPPSGPVVADLPPPNAPRVEPPAIAPSAPAPSSRATLVGGWTAREASGTTCRVQLSSTSAVDRYRAAAAGCANRDLGSVTAWDFREGEVYLYQPGGAVAARLRIAGGSLEGVLAKSGAPLSLSR